MSNSNGMHLCSAVTGGVIKDISRKYVAVSAMVDTVITIEGDFPGSFTLPAGQMWEPRVGAHNGMVFDNDCIVIVETGEIPDIPPTAISSFDNNDFDEGDFF